MKHLYLLTLEIVPLEVGKIYDDLPSHLTLMSRFLSDLPPEKLASLTQPLFATTDRIELAFGPTVELGPKKVRAHMVNGAGEQKLHDNILEILEKADVSFQYPQFIGINHKAHVTQRENVDFPPTSQLASQAAYLIEVVDGKRVVRSKLAIGTREAEGGPKS
jgi:hypothetical protein